MSYKFLEHTADIGIEVRANNLTEAFIEAIYALLELIFNKNFKEFISSNGYEFLEIQSVDSDSLFVDTLNEILFLIDTKKIIPLKPEIIELSNNSLKLKFKPYQFDFSELPMHIYVKAVTFHQLEIIQNKKSVTIKFYLDI
ncbi:MAG: archease [Ignavibacteria bacterium]|nr:archease [Ignavibacteria bacterium]